jgi:hypothetical protein
MTDEKKESIEEKTESKLKIENLQVEQRELTSEEAEALKGGAGKDGTVSTYHFEQAWPRK